MKIEQFTLFFLRNRRDHMKKGKNRVEIKLNVNYLVKDKYDKSKIVKLFGQNEREGNILKKA